MSGLDEFPLSTSAYLADTQHLSLPQHGAYLLILMTMWRAKGWIADDDQLLANICKLSVPKWLNIAPAVRALLLREGGKLTQKRLLSEFESASKTISKNRENGRAGGIAKSLKSKKSGLATATISPGARQNDKESTLPLLGLDSESRDTRKRRGNGTSLPGDWQPTATDFDYGSGLDLSERQVSSMAEDMRLWARANANRAVGRKADWTATFRGWMRREAGRRATGRRFGNNGAATALLRRMREDANG